MPLLSLSSLRQSGLYHHAIRFHQSTILIRLLYYLRHSVHHILSDHHVTYKPQSIILYMTTILHITPSSLYYIRSSQFPWLSVYHIVYIVTTSSWPSVHYTIYVSHTTYDLQSTKIHMIPTLLRIHSPQYLIWHYTTYKTSLLYYTYDHHAIYNYSVH